ncbi:MAG: hypothetical protein H6626_13565 [Pseudobdellovibrionaceae bacterium]|nr:hypothetical protein [Bdellovibrionales bacterium]USN47198.1 MAG: hypothetical protein H6626_13565 [Pseudobdellovibrionaceae bacterium]
MIKANLNILSKIRVSIFSITTFLVVIMGALVYFSLVSPPPIVIGTALDSTRSPASIVSPSAGPISEAVSDEVMPTINLGCLDRGHIKPIDSKASYVRVTGKFCNSRKSPTDTLVVKNSKSKFVASVFLVDGREFTTDYINLLPGQNEIFVQFGEGDSQSEHQFLVNQLAKAAN